jgi:DNA-binding transcriptional LysR family regulator
MERLRREDIASSLSVAMLRTYVRVVELGSMTRAAESLYLAQSAVSTQVASLASNAGGPLLERRDGRLAPTRLGRVLYEGACDVLAQLTGLEKRLHDALADETHQIAVSCTRTVCETSVAKVVSQFAQAYPEFQLSVVGGTIKDAEVRLRAGTTDVALVEGQSDLPDARLVAFHVDRLMLALPVGHELVELPAISFEQAAKYPFVLRSRASGTRLLIEQRLGRRFEQLSITLELEGNAEVAACVEAGIGLALLSESALASALSAGTLVARELTDVDLTRTFYVAVPDGRTIPDAAGVFAEWLATRYVGARLEMLTA